MSTTTPPLDLAAIRQRLAAATPGHWCKDWGRVRDDQCGSICTVPVGANFESPTWIADATFIAHAPQDMAALLAENERLEKERDEAQHELNNVWKPAAALNERYVKAAETVIDNLKNEMGIMRPVLDNLRWHANAICAISGRSEHDITMIVSDIIKERDTLRATVETLTKEREGREVELDALRTALREDRSKAELSDQYETWLDEIGQIIGCGHINDALLSCVRQKFDSIQDDRDTLRAEVAKLREHDARMTRAVEKIGFYFAGTDYQHVAERCLHVLNGGNPDDSIPVRKAAD